MIKILKFNEVSSSDIFSRAESAVNVEEIVTDIIYNVRKNGDKALYEYCEKFDKAKISSLLVTEEEIEEAVLKVEPRFIEILETAAKKISKKSSKKRPQQKVKRIKKCKQKQNKFFEREKENLLC